MDLQAADRCHRIGQSRPVSVYRLVAPRTVEAAVVARAHTKRLIATLAIDRAGLNGSVLTASAVAEEQQSASSASASPSADGKNADDLMAVPCESFGLNELSDLLYGGAAASPMSPSPSPTLSAGRSSKRAKSAPNAGAASASSPSAASLLSSSYADHRASSAGKTPSSAATSASASAPVCISDEHLARLVRDFRFDVGAAAAAGGSSSGGADAASLPDVGFEVSQFWFGQD